MLERKSIPVIKSLRFSSHIEGGKIDAVFGKKIKVIDVIKKLNPAKNIFPATEGEICELVDDFLKVLHQKHFASLLAQDQQDANMYSSFLLQYLYYILACFYHKSAAIQDKMSVLAQHPQFLYVDIDSTLHVFTHEKTKYNFLFLAVKDRCIDDVGFFLTQLNDIALKEIFKLRNKDGDTLLTLAAKEGHLKILRLIMGKAFEMYQDDEELASHLTAMDDLGCTALIATSQKNYVGIAKLFLRSTFEVLECPAKKIMFITKINKAGGSAFKLACQAKSIDIAEFLVQQVIDLGMDKDKFALHFANDAVLKLINDNIKYFGEKVEDSDMAMFWKKLQEQISNFSKYLSIKSIRFYRYNFRLKDDEVHNMFDEAGRVVSAIDRLTYSEEKEVKRSIDQVRGELQQFYDDHPKYKDDKTVVAKKEKAQLININISLILQNQYYFLLHMPKALKANSVGKINIIIRHPLFICVDSHSVLHLFEDGKTKYNFLFSAILEYRFNDVDFFLNKLNLFASMAMFNLRNSDEYNILIAACKAGNADIVECVLQKSVEIYLDDQAALGDFLLAQNNYGFTSLLASAKEGHFDIVKLILKYTLEYLKDKPEKMKIEFITKKNKQHFSAFKNACRFGHIDIAELLVIHAENIFSDKDQFALHFAGTDILKYIKDNIAKSGFDVANRWFNLQTRIIDFTPKSQSKELRKKRQRDDKLENHRRSKAHKNDAIYPKQEPEYSPQRLFSLKLPAAEEIYQGVRLMKTEPLNSKHSGAGVKVLARSRTY